MYISEDKNNKLLQNSGNVTLYPSEYIQQQQLFFLHSGVYTDRVALHWRGCG
jgi:hypothetical protein